MKNIGKPCTGKPYARFDEGGQVNVTMIELLRHRQTKGAQQIGLIYGAVSLLSSLSFMFARDFMHLDYSSIENS